MRALLPWLLAVGCAPRVVETEELVGRWDVGSAGGLPPAPVRVEFHDDQTFSAAIPDDCDPLFDEHVLGCWSAGTWHVLDGELTLDAEDEWALEVRRPLLRVPLVDAFDWDDGVDADRFWRAGG